MLSHCMKLKSVKLREGLRNIGEEAFEHCEALEEIVIPKSVRTIEPQAFNQCYALKRVTFEDPTGWEGYNRYSRKSYPLDLTDPEKNAKTLYIDDFDDGNGGWSKKE